MTILPEMLPMTTPKGRAWAWAVIDRGDHSDLQWVCWVRETGECWTFRNPQVRLEQNETMGINNGGN